MASVGAATHAWGKDPHDLATVGDLMDLAGRL